MLAQEFGWRGLMVDIDQDKIARARAKFGVNPRVSFEAIAVTPENINSLIERHGLGGEVDLFSLDIDSFDYWVLEAMTACSPRVMVLEYNGNFGPERSLAIARDTDMSRAVKGFHGASLKALTKLAAAKGYKLLGLRRERHQRLLRRNDLAPGVDAVSPEIAFRPDEGQRRSLARESCGGQRTSKPSPKSVACAWSRSESPSSWREERCGVASELAKRPYAGAITRARKLLGVLGLKELVRHHVLPRMIGVLQSTETPAAYAAARSLHRGRDRARRAEARPDHRRAVAVGGWLRAALLDSDAALDQGANGRWIPSASSSCRAAARRFGIRGLAGAISTCSTSTSPATFCGERARTRWRERAAGKSSSCC